MSSDSVMATVKLAQATVASFERREPGSINIPIRSFTGPRHALSDPVSTANDIIKSFNESLAAEDVVGIADVFLDASR